MHHIKEILTKHPESDQFDADAFAKTINLCVRTAASCTATADACMAEEDVQPLIRVVRLAQDCADICLTTSRVVSRFVEPDWDAINLQLRACARICGACSAACAEHADHYAYCNECAQMCRSCENACHEMLGEPITT